jgi:osmotically-inducible protein OsmY
VETAETIKYNVEQELRWEPSVCATRIGVSVNEGVVELDGHVNSLFEKWAAESAALRVVDVASVASEIIVDLPAGAERTDEDIASAASNHLTWNSQVPATVKLQVSKGWITLQGTAEWQFQKEEAARAVRSLRGVKAVVNEIELKSTLSTANIKSLIEDALKRDAQIEAKSIGVEAAGSMVTLRGLVRSWKEHDDAEHAAFSAPGVTCVSNFLTVSY